MRKRPPSIARELFELQVQRRQALKGLGALAISGPSLGLIACGSTVDPPGASTGGTTNGTGGSASGGLSSGGSSSGGLSSGGSSSGGLNSGGSSSGGLSSGGSSSGGTATGGNAPGSGGATPQGSGGTATGGNDGGAGRGSGGQQSGGKANGGQANGGQASGGQANGGQGQAGSGGGGLVAPPFDNVPMCTASKTDAAGQGPFFIHDKEKNDDISLIRQDIRGRYNQSAEPGVEMQLHLRILDSTSTSCNGAPVAGVEVYIWHTDAQGFYSGFGMPGEQRPDEQYAGVPGQNDLDNADRFCRGMQVTNAEGIVSFRSIFPGWYNGRDLHIHFACLKAGSASRGRMTYSGGDHLFTTQFYFDPAFSKSVHEAYQPYKRRTTIAAYENAMKADEPNNSGLRAKASLSGEIVVAQMQILLRPG